MVSLRLPMLSRAGSAAPAQGEFFPTQALASEPVMRKFCACGSAAGNVSGVVELALPATELVDFGVGKVVATATFGVCRRRSASCLP